ncbi:MAG: Maf family protein [Fidelibacterota bacterium]
MEASFILASGSPQRRELLSQLDIPFDVFPSTVEEDVQLHEEPEILVQRIALRKARQVGTRFPRRIVIGADTVVVLHGNVFGKPADRPEAAAMLRMLSGETHAVFTGVALVKRAAHAEHTFSERTDVTFLNPSDEMIDHYVRTYTPLDKAGAYGIQDWAACFVTSINGCYNNVVGFPVARFMDVLRNQAIQALFGPYNYLGNIDEKS